MSKNGATTRFFPATLILAALFIFGHADESLANDIFSDGFEVDVDNDGRADLWRTLLDDTHPRYNETSIDKTASKTGNSCMKIKVLGKNTEVYTKEFFIAEPNTMYTLSAWIKTDGFASNRSFIFVSWYDKMGNFIKKGTRSDYKTNTERWEKLVIHINKFPDNAKFFKVHFTNKGTDLSGTCLVDEVSVAGNLVLEISNAGRPGNIFYEGDKVEFDVSQKSVRPGKYLLRYRVLDYKGGVVFDWEEKSTVVKDDTSLRLAISPTPPGTGYFRIEARLLAEGKPYTEMSMGFGILPKYYPMRVTDAGDSGSFGLVVDPYASDAFISPNILVKSGLNKMKLYVWSERFTERNAEAEQYISNMIKHLYSNGVEIIGILAYPPPSIQYQLREQAPYLGHMYNFFRLPENIWSTAFLDTLTNHKDFIYLWQIGDDGDPSFSDTENFSSFVQKLTSVARKETRFLQIGIPIQASSPEEIQAIESSPALSFISLNLPNLKSPEELIDIRARLEKKKQYLKFLTIRTGEFKAGLEQPGPSPLYNPYSEVEWQLIDLAKKAVYCTVSESYNTYFITPYELMFDEYLVPTSAFYTFRACNDILGGANYIRDRFIEMENVRSYVFEKDGTGIVAFWSENGQEIVKELYLGNQPLPQIGLTGEYSMLPVGAKKTVKIGKAPSFIIGIDPKFLQTQLSVSIVPNSVESRAGLQTVDVEITNFFDRTMEMTAVALQLPSEWIVTRKTLENTNIKPGQTAKYRFTVQMPLSETKSAAQAELGITFSMAQPPTGKTEKIAAVIYRTLKIVPKIDVTYELIESESESAYKVKLEIVNRSTTLLNLRCYLLKDNYPPVEDSVAGLLPNEKKNVYFLISRDDIGKYRLFVKDTGDNYFVSRIFSTPVKKD